MSVGHSKETVVLSRSLDYLSKLCVFRSMDADDNSSVEDENLESNIGNMTDSTMQSFISEVVNRFYKTEAFCDVLIHTNTFVIKAHSLILAAVSPYFR
ncbi:hypothetical protein O3M35_011587 [Rhynocoris fuscipes]|uniref:BTB domain-containing protein n=1 Tax=Rhynocoris fuscipes TaxID=488301 RepID=A0AAW1CWS3_9HEMI